MKGPGLRAALDTRRIWRCKTCGTERHTSGQVTSVACHFCQNHPSMSLIEPIRVSRGPVPPPDLIITLHPDDVDAPAFVPVHLRQPEEASAVPDVFEVTAAPADIVPRESDAATPLTETLATEHVAEHVVDPATEPVPAALPAQNDSDQSGDATGPRKRSRGRKQGRRRKKPALQSSDLPATDPPATATEPHSEPRVESSTRPTPTAGDSFGAGIDSP